MNWTEYRVVMCVMYVSKRCGVLDGRTCKNAFHHWAFVLDEGGCILDISIIERPGPWWMNSPFPHNHNYGWKKNGPKTTTQAKDRRWRWDYLRRLPLRTHGVRRLGDLGEMGCGGWLAWCFNVSSWWIPTYRYRSHDFIHKRLMFDYFCWGCMAQPATIDHSWIKCSKNDPIFGGLRYLKIVQDYHLKIHCISNAWYIMIYPIHPYLNTWGKSNDDPSYVPPKGQASTGWTSRKKAEPGFWACKNCRVIIGYVLVAYGIIYWLVVWNIFPYIYIYWE